MIGDENSTSVILAGAAQDTRPRNRSKPEMQLVTAACIGEPAHPADFSDYAQHPAVLSQRAPASGQQIKVC